MLHSFSTKVVGCWNKVKIRFIPIKNIYKKNNVTLENLISALFFLQTTLVATGYNTFHKTLLPY